MKLSTMALITLLVGVLLGGGYLVTWSADGWADWFVFAVFVLTAVAVATAVNHRRYTTRRRTFVQTHEPPRRR